MTGFRLAIAAVVKGYKCIFTTTDKQSKEKVDALKAFGADVIVCPTNVDPDDPRSYYSVSSRLEKEIPNSWKANQYDNLSNSVAHYEQTGPEIWEQTRGRIDHLVSGVGTGGTICGTGKFLKERNPKINIWGIDTYGSLFKKYKEIVADGDYTSRGTPAFGKWLSGDDVEPIRAYIIKRRADLTTAK